MHDEIEKWDGIIDGDHMAWILAYHIISDYFDCVHIGNIACANLLKLHVEKYEKKEKQCELAIELRK